MFLKLWGEKTQWRKNAWEKKKKIKEEEERSGQHATEVLKKREREKKSYSAYYVLDTSESYNNSNVHHNHIIIFYSEHQSHVTLPPEMSHIATRSLLGYSHFPKGGAMYRFWLFNEIGFSSLFYIRTIHLLQTQSVYKCHLYKTINPSMRAIWWLFYLAISQNDTFLC